MMRWGAAICPCPGSARRWPPYPLLTIIRASDTLLSILGGQARNFRDMGNTDYLHIPRKQEYKMRFRLFPCPVDLSSLRS
jgi:hypothetical protein